MKISLLIHLVKQLKNNYSCPECNNTNISEDDITLVGAAGVSANIDMQCPSCKKHLMTQINIMDPMTLGENKKDIFKGLEKLKNTLQKSIPGADKTENITIKDSEIIDLSKKLKSQKNVTISDLFDN